MQHICGQDVPIAVLAPCMQHICGQDVPTLGVEVGLSRLFRLFIVCGATCSTLRPFVLKLPCGFGDTLNILKHCPQRETVFAGI